MGQPKHIRVVDDNGDVHDNHPGPGNDRVSRAPVSQNRRSGRLCHPRWSRITKLHYRTNDQVLDEVKQISFEGAATGNLSGPRASALTANGPYDQLWLAPTEL
jgi:hypothetical protein